MADSGNWRTLRDILTKAFPGVRITSTYRPGSTGSGGRADHHSTGNAVDIGSPNMAIFNWIVANYPDSSEVIYAPAGNRQIKNGKPFTYSAAVAAGHHDHIHWARAGATGAPSSGVGAVSGAVAGSTAAGGSDPFAGVSGALNDIGQSFAAVSAVAETVNKLALPQTWVRIVAGLAGTLLVFFGLWKLTTEVRA